MIDFALQKKTKKTIKCACVSMQAIIYVLNAGYYLRLFLKKCSYWRKWDCLEGIPITEPDFSGSQMNDL